MLPIKYRLHKYILQLLLCSAVLLASFHTYTGLAECMVLWVYGTFALTYDELQ
jgi:hypothetical protein